MDFSKLKVVELASVLAGPAVGMFFAELGAQVTKVENKTTNGDVTRQWKNKNENPNSKISAYFSSVNWGKKHVFLDLKEEKDYESLIEIVKEADVVIGNYNHGAAEKLKVDYDTLLAINPTIIYGNISGYGENSKRAAYDVVLQAESGFMYMNGTPESGPVKMPLALMDVLTAHQLKEGLLVALLQRERDNKAKYVCVSLYDTAVASLYNQATNWLMSGHLPEPIGSLHPNISPYGETVACNDGVKIVLAIGSNAQFAKLCELIGNKLLASKPEYLDNGLRVQNRGKLQLELQASFGRLASTEILPELINNKVPCGAINNLQQVFTNLLANDLLVHETIDDENTVRVRTTVFKISSP